LLNVRLSRRIVEFTFIAPDTYPKKLIGRAARMAATRCSNVQAVLVRVRAGSTRVQCGCRDAFAQERMMLRKIMMALAASATLALAVAPTDASAHGHGGMGGGRGWGGHGGWGHAGFAHGGFVRGGFARGGFVRGGFHRFGFFPHRRFFFAGGYPYYGYGGCWRWVPGPWGLHRAWVCGYRPYAYRYGSYRYY
jgi:hypothetical protein